MSRPDKIPIQNLITLNFEFGKGFPTSLLQEKEKHLKLKVREGGKGARAKYNTTLYYAILYSDDYYTVLYYTKLYYTIQHYTALYYTVLYYTVLYYTVR